MITIIDYGVGNIKAFQNIYKRLGIEASVAQNPNYIKAAEKLILPGVGHFDYAMQCFSSSGMMEITNEMVLNGKTPILGVCVGMQMLAKSSDEGQLPGLGWVNADVRKFDFSQSLEPGRLPHMGWNDVISQKENPLLLNLEKNARFYFLHSYYFNCMDREDNLAISHYGFDFTSIINHRNIYGVQFHPEKSHNFGVQLLKNFAEI